jgi:uncharacterized protein YkwD
VKARHHSGSQSQASRDTHGSAKWRANAVLIALLCSATFSNAVRSEGRPSPASDGLPRRTELQMWEMINADRTAPSTMEETKGQARPLEWDDKLAEVARQHSEDMAQNEFFSHTGSDGSSPALRTSKAGIQWRRTGENIAKVQDVPQAERLFMDEPKFQQNHRANILKPEYTRVGVGIARGRDGALYITQEFAELR